MSFASTIANALKLQRDFALKTQGYNDAGSAAAVESLKATPGVIGGEVMANAIYNATADLDDRAASREYADLKKFVTDNGWRLSPDAQAKFGVYESYVHKALSEGRVGIPIEDYQRMVIEINRTQAPVYHPFLQNYRSLINGGLGNNGTGYALPGDIAPPMTPFDAGEWQRAGQPDLAANQEATVTGDPHVKEADGGLFDFQGEPGKSYNLINDRGLILNAQFQMYNGNPKLTTMKEIGGMVAGPSGSSFIRINAQEQPPLKVNGIALQAGQTQRLADGGSIALSADGKIVTFSTAEGYQNTVTVQGSGTNAYLDYSLRSGAQGVGADGLMPGGLVGHTFDADTTARNGKTGVGAQGEGAIDGVYTDYEVSGLFGFPQTQILKPETIPMLASPLTDPAYQHYFGIAPGTDSSLIPADNLQQMWDQVVTDSNNQASVQNGANAAHASDQKSKKLQLLLQAALASGNIDMALLLMAGLESQQANAIASGLLQNIQARQQERSAIAEQIGKEKDPGKASELNTKAGNLSTDIQLMQTFLQDVMSQKSEAQSMASNLLKTRHDTGMSIIRNMA